MSTRLRWCFADQLGPHFLGPPQSPGDDGEERVLLVESRAAFARRPYHRAKAHLVLSALRHRAAELGDRCVYVAADTYSEALAGLKGAGRRGRAPTAARPQELSVVDPTSYAARRFVRGRGLEVLPSRGFVTDEGEFSRWADGRHRLVLEDFYREARRRTGVLMDGDEPRGGRWNFDAENRQPPPRGARSLGLPEPRWPEEDAIDAQVRADLDDWERRGLVRFTGRDGPRRFAVTRDEALATLEDFAEHRLASFGPYEDAAMAHDWVMAHSLLSAPMNLGLLSPLEAIDRVVSAGTSGKAGLPSVEGFVRQVMGWRDYVWHLYWYFGEEYAHSNALQARTPLPDWWRNLDAESVRARCLSTALAEVRDRGWNHHILRLMVLGNWALQHGFDPRETTEWFTASYVDAYPWVMGANVLGMALYADGGRMATKPYACGGAYIHRMTDLCRGCDYRPTERVGERGCPVTAGYWAFLDRHRADFSGNHRMAQALRGLDRLADLPQVVDQERGRGSAAP